MTCAALCITIWGMADSQQIGIKIKRARERLRWRQQDLADKLGVSRNAVDAWENGRAYPKRSIGALEAVLGISLDGADGGLTEWERWERSVLANPDLPADVARALVSDARAARDAHLAAAAASPADPSSPASPADRTAAARRHRAAG